MRLNLTIKTKSTIAMKTISKIKDKVKQVGIADLIRIIYFNRILRPALKYYVRKKYQNEAKYLNNDFFYKLLDKSRVKFKSNKKAELIAHLADREYPIYFSESLQINKESYQHYFEDEGRITLYQASRILENDFKWITPRCPKFDQNVNWHSTFKNNDSWPLDFFMDLDYSSEKRPGDVREVWELNRHQFFITLGKAYFITDDEKYAKKFVELIDDWIDKNPCGYGINWLHSQETGIRMISWIWAFYFFKNSEHFTDDLKIKFFKSLYQHAEYTYLTLSRGLTTHNHLVSEICGLLIFSLMFPEFKKSKRWFKTSLKIYKREILKQIWESGPSGELSTNYHLFVLDSFLQVYVLLKNNSYNLSTEIEHRLEKMIEYAAYFIKPDGSIPKIGDNDSGRSFKLSEADENDRRYYLAVGAALFKNKNFKIQCSKFYEEAFWLLGTEGFKQFEELNASETIIYSKYFTPTGFAIFRDGISKNSTHLVFRGGPTQLRKNVSTSHNHADFLSLELYTKGYSIFSDPGTYLYSYDDNWRFYYRKSFCHNTVSIDQLDSADVTATRFGLPNLPLSKLNSIQTTDKYDYIDMTSSGYNDYKMSHRRKVFFLNNEFILIIDIIEGDGSHKIKQNFNIDDRRLNIDIIKNKICLSCSNNFELVSILPFAIKEPEISVSKGKTNPIDGWGSDKYGEKHETSILRFSYNENLPFVCGLFINLNPAVNKEIEIVNMNFDSQKIKVVTKGSVKSIRFENSTLNYFVNE